MTEFALVVEGFIYVQENVFLVDQGSKLVVELFLSFREIEPQKTLTIAINTDNCREKINHLEHVEFRVTVNYTLRGELLIKLTSPQRTVSNLTHYRLSDATFGATDLTNWTLMTLHYWGENADGQWLLTLQSSHPKHDNKG